MGKLLAVVISLAFIASCQSHITSPNKVSIQAAGKLSLKINMENAPTDVTQLSGILYRADQDTVFFDFIMHKDSAIALVENVIHGNWYLKVDALNELGVIIFTGSNLLTVFPDQVTIANLHLMPTTGSINIVVTWDNNQDYALNFDGIDDCVLVPNNEKLNIKNSITLEAWIYPYDVSTIPDGGSRMILRKGNVYHTINYNMRIDVNNGVGVLGFGITGSGVLSEEGSLRVDQWQHVAGVYDSQTHNMKVFVDAVLVGQTVATSVPELSDDPLSFGLSFRSNDFGIEDFFLGMMDDVRIWNIARTQKEIQENMNRQLVGTENGLVANWKMNEGNGQMLNDYINNLNGQLGLSQELDKNDPTWVIN